jgi:hypothetical protein
MKNTFVSLIFIALICASSQITAADIYKILHSDGTVSYSDQPPMEGQSDEVVLPDLFVLPAVSIPSSPIANATPSASTPSKSIRIHSPLDEEVIRGPDNSLSIRVSVSPAIAENERLQLIHNGNPYGQPQSSGQWNLTRLPPGTQKFSVQLIGENSQSIGESSPLTVYVIL